MSTSFVATHDEFVDENVFFTDWTYFFYGVKQQMSTYLGLQKLVIALIAAGVGAPRRIQVEHYLFLLRRLPKVFVNLHFASLVFLNPTVQYFSRKFSFSTTTSLQVTASMSQN